MGVFWEHTALLWPTWKGWAGNWAVKNNLVTEQRKRTWNSQMNSQLKIEN